MFKVVRCTDVNGPGEKAHRMGFHYGAREWTNTPRGGFRLPFLECNGGWVGAFLKHIIPIIFCGGFFLGVFSQRLVCMVPAEWLVLQRVNSSQLLHICSLLEFITPY